MGGWVDSGCTGRQTRKGQMQRNLGWGEDMAHESIRKELDSGWICSQWGRAEHPGVQLSDSGVLSESGHVSAAQSSDSCHCWGLGNGGGTNRNTSNFSLAFPPLSPNPFTLSQVGGRPSGNSLSLSEEWNCCSSSKNKAKTIGLGLGQWAQDRPVGWFSFMWRQLSELAWEILSPKATHICVLPMTCPQSLPRHPKFCPAQASVPLRSQDPAGKLS